MKISKYLIQAAILVCASWVMAGCQDMGQDIPFDYPEEQADNLRPDPPTYNPLKLYMAFDDNLNNSSRYSWNINASGTVAYDEGASNNAYKAGAGNYILLEPTDQIYKGNVNYADTLANMKSLTFSTWFYLPSANAGGAQNIFSITNTAQWWGNLDVFVDGDNKVKVHMFNYNSGAATDAWVDFDYKAAGSVLVDKWVYFTVTYDGTTSMLKTYINGEEKTTATLDGAAAGELLFENVGPLVIGDWAQNTSLGSVATEGWASNFKGDIDQVRLYNKAMTAAEISVIYNTEKPGIPDYSPLKFFLKYQDNVTDASNYLVPTTATGTMSYVSGVVGQGVQMGAGKYIVATPPTGTRFNLADSLANLQHGFTYATWFYYPTSGVDGAQMLFSMVNTDKEWGNLDVFVDGSDKVKVHTFNYATGAPVDAWVDVDYTALSMPILDRWVHYAVSYNPTTSTFLTYINGVQASSTPVAGYGELQFQHAGPMIIGDFAQNTTVTVPFLGDWAKAFSGKLDQTRFYNRTMSATEITGIYDSESAGVVDPMMWLKFNDNITDGSTNAIPTVAGGTLTYDTGSSGKALQCGDNKYVLVNPGAGIMNTFANIGSFTVSLMYNQPTSAGTGPQCLFSISDMNKEWDNVNVFIENNDIKAFVSNYNKMNGDIPADTWAVTSTIRDAWTHYVLTYDQSTQKLRVYINGTQAVVQDLAEWGAVKWNNLGTSAFVAGNFTHNAYPDKTPKLGDWAGAFKGLLDNVRMYDVALNENQIADLYATETAD